MQIEHHLPTPNTRDAFEHPAYDNAVARAVYRARTNPGECFTVYWDGAAIFLRASHAAPPPNSKVVCIAQRWDDGTVQVRFDGARSEWVRS